MEQLLQPARVSARPMADPDDLDSYQGMQPEKEGEIEFAALMRRLDKQDPGYRH